MKKDNIPWDGFDLDGCLATYILGKGERFIGQPIKSILDKLLEKLSNGYRIKIVTARVSREGHNWFVRRRNRKLIELWCMVWIGRVLEVTAEKDPKMMNLYDDRVTKVEFNTGRIIA